MISQRMWQVRFELPDDLRWQLREAASRRRVTLQQALVEAVEAWIALQVDQGGAQ